MVAGLSLTDTVENDFFNSIDPSRKSGVHCKK
jgi:hypothetical protein